MTAIAAAYVPATGAFIIAADGRCASDTLPMVIQTDKQQKIFFAQHEQLAVVYAMTGFARTDDGSFDMVTEADQQIKALIKRSFRDGFDFSTKFYSNIKKSIEDGIKTGRIAQIPLRETLDPQEKGRLSTFFLLGYYRGGPFWRLIPFYCEDSLRNVQVRPETLQLSQFRFACTGSDKIRGMIYGSIPFDPRLSIYRFSLTENSDPFAATTNFVKACSDPVAVVIDPWCRLVGGHIHAAEITKSGFRWLIPPVA